MPPGHRSGDVGFFTQYMAMRTGHEGDYREKQKEKLAKGKRKPYQSWDTGIGWWS